MEHLKIRIDRLSVNDIKCVASGHIDFNAIDALRQEKASIMGIYGQNGSGKTVVIESLSILKSILSGQQISSRYFESIAIGKKSGCLEIVFSVIGNENSDCIVTYKCELGLRENPNENTMKNGAEMKATPDSIIAVTSESLKISGLVNDEYYSRQYIAQTDETQKLIRPKQKCRLLFGSNDDTLKRLERQKILALYGSRSFIFSNQAAEVIEDNCKNNFGFIINSIRLFATARLFIVGGETQSEIPFPFNFVIETKNRGFAGQIPFSLESKTLLPKEILAVFESFVRPLNLVLSSIIPGLSIVYKTQKASLDEKDSAYEIELFASRDQVCDFPLRHESLGIKKMISFLTLLIATYNDAGHVLAVDEFDSSIFEFLLGELMSIIKDSGRGQLIFTSHNLRPLEKLDDSSICFTTAEPNNRYITIKKKATNNLRDIYFRLISLGNDNYELYSSESKNAIAFAFSQAGREE